MKTLFTNARIINVFTDEIMDTNLLIEDEHIVGFGNYYTEQQADQVIDVAEKYICPALINAHTHVESSKITPYHLSDILCKKGTCAIVADPHEIANVCGVEGIKDMINETSDLNLKVFFTIPSCVPASPFDESYQVLNAKDIEPLYDLPRVIGLAEMMNYPGVINGDEQVLKKLYDAQKKHKIINGHAPLLSGKGLDTYISFGIGDDHEITNIDEAKEKIQKGQFCFIREGSSAKDLEALIELFKPQYNHRCALCTDDITIADIVSTGYVDHIIRKTARLGVNPLIPIRMATIQAAQYYRLEWFGAIAPGYYANFIILSDLEKFAIDDVYIDGKNVSRTSQKSAECSCGGDAGQKTSEFRQAGHTSHTSHTCHTSHTSKNQTSSKGSMLCKKFAAKDFMIDAAGQHKTRVIKCIPNSILTEECIELLNFDVNNGIYVEKDIVKLAAIERHGNSGNIALGFAQGFQLEGGALATSVSHDSHNLTVLGTNETDMQVAQSALVDMQGGHVIVQNGKVLATFEMEIGGLMTDKTPEEAVHLLQKLRDAQRIVAPKANFDIFDTLQFVSLTVIPSLKLSTTGLVDVNQFKFVPLLAD